MFVSYDNMNCSTWRSIWWFLNIFHIITSDRHGISLMYTLLQQDGGEHLECAGLEQLYHCCDKHMTVTSSIMLVTIMCFIFVWTIVSGTGCHARVAMEDNNPNQGCLLVINVSGKAYILYTYWQVFTIILIVQKQLSKFSYYSNFLILMIMSLNRIFSPAMTYFSPAVSNNVRVKTQTVCFVHFSV